MPRITKRLPANRADYTFGDLVYWHLFKFGTRPDIDPSAPVGRPWKVEAIAPLLGKTDKTLRNWINGKSLPDDIADLCRELFGNNPAWDEARLELLESLENARTGKRATAAPVAEVPHVEDATRSIEGDAGAGADGNGDEADTDTSETTDPSGTEPPRDERHQSEHDRLNRPPNAAGSRELVAVRPIRLKAKYEQTPKHSPSYRRAVASAVAGLVIFFAAYAWFGPGGRKAEKPATPEVALVPEPKKEAESPKPVHVVPALPPVVPEPPKVEAPKIEPPKPRVPTAEELRQAEEDRLEKQHMEARREAFEAERIAREEEALRLDRENSNRARELASLENDARIIAGMGYRLEEHRRVSGTSIGHVYVSTVGDCAVACTRASCDAFGYKRARDLRGQHKRTACYFFRKPFIVEGYEDWVHGEPTDQRRPASVGSMDDDDQPIVRVQAKKSEPKTDDGLTRCATGPVKASGFKLTCDRTMGGGTTLGSTRLSYTVANINECAAKCRPVQKCVGFTFNAADPAGQHACIIFGPTPEARDSKGWISGTR